LNDAFAELSVGAVPLHGAHTGFRGSGRGRQHRRRDGAGRGGPRQRQRRVRGPLHLSIGQGAVRAGGCAHLQREDLL